MQIGQGPPSFQLRVPSTYALSKLINQDYIAGSCLSKEVLKRGLRWLTHENPGMGALNASHTEV